MPPTVPNAPEFGHFTEASVNGEIAFLNEVLNSTSAGVCFIRASDGTLIYSNSTSAKMFGYAPGEMLGKHISLFNAEHSQAPSPQKIPAHIEELRSSGWKGDVRSRRKDGSLFWCHVSTKLFKHPTFGDLYVSIKEDITARKEREERLALLSAELEETQRLAELGSWSWSLEGDKVIWSDMVYKIFGLNPTQLPPPVADHSKMFTLESWERLSAALQSCTKEGTPYLLELEILRANGSRGFVVARGQPERDSTGIVVGAHGTIIDITEAKSTEQRLHESRIDQQQLISRLGHAHQELQESRENLRALLARQHTIQDLERIAMSREVHDELGQLLTALKMEIRTVEKALSCVENQSFSNEILDHAVASSAIVDTLIGTVQRIAAGLRPGLLRDQGLVDALSEKAQNFSERYGIPCSVDITMEAQQLPIEAERELYHICREALTNVARHAHATKVKLSLTLEGNDAIFQVQDDGIGISEFRLHSHERLGIVGMQERALQVGGSLKVTRCFPHGTLVTVRIPMERVLLAGGS